MMEVPLLSHKMTSATMDRLGAKFNLQPKPRKTKFITTINMEAK